MLCSKQFICLTVIFCVVALKVNANCVCKEKGTDFCAPCTDRQRIVRPQSQRVDEKAKITLPPIGDNCWCSKQLVQPAPLPKPPCLKHNTPTCECKVVTNAVGKVPKTTSCVKHLTTNLNYVPLVQPLDNSPPADPVSISLAVQAEKAIKVPEFKVAYGFAQPPVNQLQKVFFSQVPEEKLFKLNSDVITLPKRPTEAAYNEDEIVDYVEQIDSDVDVVSEDKSPQLTYKQLGFVVEKYKNPKFRKVYPEREILSYKQHEATDNVNYGYKHLNVYKPTRKCGKCRKH